MSDPIPFRPVDASVERKERAEEAKELLENRAFTTAILALRKRYFETLMTADNDAARLALIERIRALEDLPGQLQLFVNDQTMAARKK